MTRQNLMRSFVQSTVYVPWKRVALFLLISLPMWLGLHNLVPYRILEVMLLGAMLFVLAGSKPLIDLYRSLARPYRIFSAGLLVLFLVGHTARRNDFTFPFVGWTMYGYERTNSSLVFHELRGITQSGASVEVNPGHILPSGGPRMVEEVTYQIRNIEREQDPTRRASLMQEHTATLNALAGLYNRQHAGDPIERITVSEQTFAVKNEQAGTLPQQKLLWEIAVEAAK